MSPTHGRLLIHLLFLIFHLLLIIPRISTSYPDLWGSECSPSSTTGSAFKANRDLLLQSLSTAAVDAAGFFNNTVGDSPDQVFGLAMCWAYGDQETCRTCLAAAVANFSQGPKCPGSRDVSQDAAIWYNDCFLRYSNESFFSVVDTNWSWEYTVDGYNASEPDRFNRTMAQLANQLMNEAASSPQKFAVGKANFTSSDSLYGLLQCTRDLSKSDCYRCLNTYLSVLPACCYSQRGASIYGKSCYLRYEVYPFFNESLLQSSPPGMVPSHVQAGAGTKGLSGTIVVIAVSLAAVIIILTTSACLWRWRTVRRISSNIRSESLLCDFHSLRAATDNFSEKNKLGEGGFGVVHKGTLPDGQEIAVKRLVKIVGRGTEAIQNEVNLLARLEHRNLVRLLGSCIEEKEKLLVYEYMPNRSLDTFLFADDPMKRREMDWKTRLNIIKGISRGLHYLHEESRIKVIHRDLKTSNILLDENMNPKISDFGLARLFSSDRTHEATSNVAGTFGYMAPEYVRHGTFSTKSDVFSFGVLLLEVVTGRKNASFGDSEFALDLVRYARKQWNEGKVLELQDPILGEQWPEQELQRCIHIGLLCVQEEPIQRPSVEAIELMLNSYSMTVPVLQPASFDWVVKSSTSKKQTITDSDLYSNEH